ncbi:hypothetical protein FUAX_50410 (plasmid) [Fulvitalea axinellae]|uniref:Uncharacterized protein n=1 Tax=Fulvitalea axinellae TaxID=1182444 RepID=A0AAU9D1W7_9BACT|nr:hypothetical protein FUAX_50410 [Fulvitalea axinellae]
MFQERGRTRKSTSLQSQSNGESKTPIQCLIGYEFEIADWILFKEQERQPEQTDLEYREASSYKKGTLLYEEELWQMVADTDVRRTPYMEFVTKPFPETIEGYGQALDAFSEIRTLCQQIWQSVPEPHPDDNFRYLPLSDVINFLNLADENAMLQTKLPNPAPTFSPQTTAGVVLSELPAVFAKLAGSYLTDPEDLAARKRQGQEYMSTNGTPGSFALRYAVDRSRDLTQSWGLSKHFEGFFSYVLFYLIQAYGGTSSYAKNFTSILARTDFARMFELLPLEEQEWLKENNASEFLDLIEWALPEHANNLDTPFFFRGIFLNMPATHHQMLKRLTRRTWLVDITKGMDRLTERNFPNRLRAYEMESLGAMGDKTDEIKGIQAPILEFRGGRKRLTPDEAEDYVSESFKMLLLLHEGQDTFWGE